MRHKRCSEEGLRAAARRVFDATNQRCRVHWLRNALAHAPARQRTAAAGALRDKNDRLGIMMDASRIRHRA